MFVLAADSIFQKFFCNSLWSNLFLEMRSKEKIPSTCNTSVMGDVYPGLIYNSKSRDSNSSAFNNSQSQESISNIRTPSSQRGSSHSRNKEEATHSHQPSITSSTRSPPAEIRRKECDSVILPEIIGGWHSLQHHKVAIIDLALKSDSDESIMATVLVYFIMRHFMMLLGISV